MKEYTVKIKPLTPLWTGDAERKPGTLRETGIIGSLRWWYEALIRGLGGTACLWEMKIVLGRLLGF
jgi:CRISPR-associated protein Cmr1